VNSVYDRYCWPGPEIIGRDGVEACNWIVGHAVASSELQIRTTELMKAALPCGHLYGYYYANLLDRRLALAYLPTVFGSFFSKTKRVFSAAEETIQGLYPDRVEWDTHKKDIAKKGGYI